jgi:hypothetical protein
VSTHTIWSSGKKSRSFWWVWSTSIESIFRCFIGLLQAAEPPWKLLLDRDNVSELESELSGPCSAFLYCWESWDVDVVACPFCFEFFQLANLVTSGCKFEVWAFWAARQWRRSVLLFLRQPLHFWQWQGMRSWFVWDMSEQWRKVWVEIDVNWRWDSYYSSTTVVRSA